jgi:tetratricopeptide (TPR) repeat protein
MKKRAYYAQIVEHADGLFDGGDYEQALPAYTEANSLFPKEIHPIERIARINTIMEERKALADNYARYVKEGDQNFGMKSYQTALTSYQQAKALKPEEAYPRDQIALIEKAMEAEKALLDNYQQTIASADEFMAVNRLAEAREEYTKALTLKQGEPYPGEQIKIIDARLAQAAQLEKDYKAAIDEADQYYKEKKLSEALGKYTLASSFKPENTYPKEQIAQIEASLAALRSRDEQYAAHISEGDMLFGNTELEAAATAYSKALEIKPGEKYPGERIANITKTLEEQRKKRVDFTTLIERADQLFDAGKYEQALPVYVEAKGLFLEEPHPAERIERINKIIEDRKALEENYARYVKEGDQNFEKKSYQTALTAYQQAKTLKPEETYPKNQLALIEKALAAEKALLDTYQQAIATADEMFNAGNLNEAATKYAEAKKIKPDESYPGEQIERVNALLALRKETEKKYTQSIEDGNRLFAAKEYEAARTKYTEAAGLKPTELYPAEKIAEIQTLLGALEQVEEQYNTAISLAEEKLDLNLLDEAETAYQQAKRIKPQEAYPTKQLEIIQQRREKEKTLAFNYENAVSKGDAMYQAKDYASALIAYQQALEFKPGAEHPANRVQEITNLLQVQIQLADKGYNEAIDNADRLFTEKDYSSALKFYENASALKPIEKYPKDKILAIRSILQERSRNQMEAYNKIILNADRLYQDKVLDQAIDAYMDASVAKPDETYPLDMIAKIRKYLEDHAMVDLVNSPISIETDSEKRFDFTAIDMRLRKNNYISINARKTSETDPKVYVNYGKGSQKNGGIVLKSITSDENGDFLVRVSIQDRWYREDNNWIGIYAEGGSIEISKMKIAQGD